MVHVRQGLEKIMMAQSHKSFKEEEYYVHISKPEMELLQQLH